MGLEKGSDVSQTLVPSEQLESWAAWETDDPFNVGFSPETIRQVSAVTEQQNQTADRPQRLGTSTR